MFDIYFMKSADMLATGPLRLEGETEIFVNDETMKLVRCDCSPNMGYQLSLVDVALQPVRKFNSPKRKGRKKKNKHI